MSSIDQLQIEIQASSQNATRAIDGLISSLQNLNRQLGLKDGTRFSQTLNSMARAMDNFTGTLNSVNSSALDGVARGAATVGENADVAADKVKKLADNLDLVKESQQLGNALGGANYSKKLILGKDANMGNVNPTEFGFTSDIPSLTAAQKLIEDINSSLSDFKTPELDEYFRRTAEAAKLADENIRAETEAMERLQQSVQGISEEDLQQQAIGKFFGSNDLGDTISAFDKIKMTLGDIKSKAPGMLKGFGKDTLINLLALSHGLEELSHHLSEASERSKKLFKTLVTPLKMAAGEYVEKFEHMKGSVSNFVKNVQSKMTKLAAFWKRIMRTFTFMLVRKAITAIIKEVNNAIQSMAMFSNAMGTQFNNSISTLVADFQYLGRSIVSVFAPLINFIAPIIDAIVDKIATLLMYIGMLMAALTGASSFTKAKKNVGNYAESLDKASKSAKNLTMGIDELNILSEKSGGGSSKPYDGWEDAWEEVDIPDWLKDLANKIKKFWEDFIAPIKKAWEKVKAYFKFAFDYMKEQVLELAKSIYDAFMKVWNQDATVEMIANILRIVADLMIVVGNLAKRFREAWDEAERGVRIFEGIRDILAILVEHIRNVTWYMVGWSDSLDFAPLLDSVIGLLDAFKELADFIGGVFEDVMKNVVLKYIKWMIEEAIPHLNHVISEVIEAFDFGKIREDLVPLEEAFERLMENVHTGVTNAIGNLGERIAEFTNSQEFTDFLQRIADIMDLISAEDVEKILTGIGEGILAIAEAVVKFVNSDIFMGFLEAIDSWLADTSSSDIAGILTGIAVAIGLFDFAAFLTGGVAEFLKFFAIIKAAGALGPTLAALKVFGGVISIVAGAAAAIGAFFKMWNDGWSVALEIIKDVGIALVALGVILVTGVAALPVLIVAAVVAALSTIAILVHEHWDEICQFFTETIPAWWEGTAVPWLQSLPQRIGEFIGNLWATIKAWASEKITAIAEWLEIVKTTILLKVAHIIVGVVQFFNELPEKIGYALGFIIAKFVEWCGSVVTWVQTNVPIIINSIVTYFVELPSRIFEWLKETVQKFIQWKHDVGEWITTNVPLIIDDIVHHFAELALKIFTKIIEVKEKFNEWKRQLILWISTEVPKIISEFMKYFNEIPQKLKDLGTNIVQGLLDGINDAWSRLKGGVSDFCSGFIQGFKDALGIASPSKETEEIGKFSLEGLLIPFTEDITEKLRVFTELFLSAIRIGLDPVKFTEIGTQIILALTEPLQEGVVQLEEYLQEHFDMFSNWWDTSMLAWWENQVKPFFEEDLWKELFTAVLRVARIVFDEVIEAISERVNTAAEAVASACESMRGSLAEVLSVLDEIASKAGEISLGGLQLTAGQFAAGGFPSQGSLFFASEAGPELIGTVGGRTAVASNGEITGITDAVYATGNVESELLAQLITIGRQIIDKDPVIIGDKDIAKMSNNGQGKLGMSIIS